MILCTKAQEKHLTPEYISALKVDSWIFLSLKGLTKSVITFDTALFAVFKAEYPTPVSYNSLEKLTHYLQMCDVNWYSVYYRKFPNFEVTSLFFFVFPFLHEKVLRKLMIFDWSPDKRNTFKSSTSNIFLQMIFR